VDGRPRTDGAAQALVEQVRLVGGEVDLPQRAVEDPVGLVE